MSEVEHVNLTVRDAKSTAKMLCGLFDWNIRWEGEVLAGKGYSIHVGSPASYLALYSPHDGTGGQIKSGKLNHIGVLVDDVDAIEEKVIAAGYKPTMHADYEPGRRFYFLDEDGVEFEVVSYE